MQTYAAESVTPRMIAANRLSISALSAQRLAIGLGAGERDAQSPIANPKDLADRGVTKIVPAQKCKKREEAKSI